jgi:hypothetical protein
MGVVVFICGMYISLFKLFVFDGAGDDVMFALFIPLQLSFFMLVWSMVRVILSDPGKVYYILNILGPHLLWSPHG